MRDAQRHIEQSLFEALAKLPQQKDWVVAYSGGADSTALLLACYQYLQKNNQQHQLSAIHINHGISANADAWQSHCQVFCEQHAIPFTAFTVDLDATPGKGLEQKARDARYNIFQQQLSKQQILLLAHHKQDQQETFLMRLFRGAGPEGLAAMPASRAIGDTMLYRPLLDIEKPRLLMFLKNNHCDWVEDESNQDTALARNYIRHQLLPEISHYSATATQSLSNSIELIQQQNKLLQYFINAELELRMEQGSMVLSFKEDDLQSPEFVSAILRQWFSQLGLLMPDRACLDEMIENLLMSSEDSQPEMRLQGKIFRRFQAKLYCLQPSEPEQIAAFDWQLMQQTELQLDGLGKLLFLDDGSFHDDLTLQVRGRQQGDKICLNAALGRQSLKKIFQQHLLPPWQRNNTPLLVLDQQLIAIPELDLYAESCPSGLKQKISFTRS